MNSEVILFTSKEKCCGCGACMNACPKQAISMKEDAYGFLYPEIDTSLCVGCKLCQKACAFQNKQVTHEPLATYAACSQNSDTLKKSASGGAFSVLAESILEENGVVFGASFTSDWNVCHISIENIEELSRLQGSKYVQSNTEDTFQKVKSCLKSGKKVLYSGTPCQIAGLYGFLGKEPENLITIDLICHGVPNQHMFQDYLHTLGTVQHFTFRDKSLGWGINGTAVADGTKIKLWQSASPYLYYFSRGMIYRDSCYQCKYACQHRPADITLGDFWGIEKQHPEYLKTFDEKKGISVIIANTEKGKAMLEKCSHRLVLKPSEFKKAQAGNTQLRHPSRLPEQRSELFSLYQEQGWSAVEKRFRQKIGLRRYSSQIKSCIPSSIKKTLKKLK